MKLEARASDWALVSWMIDQCDGFSVPEHLAFERGGLQCLSGAYSRCNMKRTTILDAIRSMPLADIFKRSLISLQ